MDFQIENQNKKLHDLRFIASKCYFLSIPIPSRNFVALYFNASVSTDGSIKIFQEHQKKNSQSIMRKTTFELPDKN